MAAFDGFQDKDFAGLKGTAWRGRKALGGVLAAALPHQPGQPYESWAVARSLQLHIAQRKQYVFRHSWPCAKLFVYTKPKELAYGFHIESPGVGEREYDPGEFVHWRKFKERLRSSSEIRQALLSAMKDHDLVMTDYFHEDTGGALGCKFAFQGGRLKMWCPEKPTWADTEVELLVRLIAELPKKEWVDLHVFTQVKQKDAVDMGDRVKGHILSVLSALKPVYEMSVK
jgi:hypothetical protein